MVFPVLSQAQTSWKGTSSTAWKTADNWTAGVPTASVDAIIGDTNFTGSFQPTISASAACKSLTLGTGTKASTLTVSRALTVSGDITIGTNGVLSHSANTISLTGNWNNSGAYNSGTAPTVTFAGTTQFINGGVTTFKKVNINSGSTTTLGTNVVVSTYIVISGTLDPNESPAYAISGSGTMTVNSGGTIRVKASTFSGNYGMAGTKTINAGSTVDYAATNVNQSVTNSLTYSSLRISGGMTKTLSGNLPALNSTAATAGNITVVGGTLDLSTFTANRGTSVVGGIISVSGSAILKIGGTNSFPANYATRSMSAGSIVEYYGTNQTVSAETYGNLILSSSGSATKTFAASPFTVAGNFSSATNVGGASVSFTAGEAITVGGNVNIGSGTTFNGGSYSHSVGGNWTNDGTFTGASSTVTMNGANCVLSGMGSTTFNNLVFPRSGSTMTTNTSVTVAGNISTIGVGTFTHTPGGNGTITLSGTSKTISGLGLSFNDLVISGSISTADSFTVLGNLGVNGSFSASGGALTLAGSGKTFYGSGTIAYNELNVTGSITTTNSFSVAGNCNFSGSFAATAGTITFAGTTLYSGTASLFDIALNGTLLRVAAGSLIRVAGMITYVAGTFDPNTLTPNTVVYNGAAGQVVFPVTYNNLMIASAGAKDTLGNITATGNFTIDTGATFNGGAGNYTNYIRGNWLNLGTFNAGNSTVEFTGTADATISGSSTFNKVRINKNNSSVKTLLTTNQTVSTLDVVSGWLNTDTNTITITSARTGSGIILGNITRTHSFTTGTAYAFEGPNNTITFSSLGTINSVTVNAASAPVADFPFGASINRQYTIGVTGSGSYAATLRLHYEDSELNGNTESLLGLWRANGSWSLSGKTANDSTANWVEQSSLTNITGRWTLAEDTSVVRWNGSVSTAWTNASNWTVVEGAPNLPPGTNDIVELGTTSFGNQPTISSSVAVKGISFGSVQAVTLTLGSGGSLVTGGNIGGSWTNNATHTISVGAQNLTVGGDLILSDDTNNHAINLTASTGTITVAGSLTESGGANITFTGAGALNICGTFYYSSGTFTAGSSTVTYNGNVAQTVAGVTYNNLGFNKSSGTATLFSPTTVNGNLVLTNGIVTLDSTLTVIGDVTLASGTTLNGGTGNLTISGNWVTGGTFVPGASTIIFTGSNTQNIGAATFNNLTINKISGTATPSGNLTINGDLSVSTGTFNLSGFTANRSAAGGTLTLSSGTTLKIGSSFPADFSVRTLAASSIVEYNGTNTQSVSGETYGELIFSNGGSNAKTLAGATTVQGNLLINSNSTFNGSSYLIDLFGNWTNNGTFSSANSTLKLDGSGKVIAGNNTFSNLVVAGSYTVVGTNLYLTGNLTTSGTLDGGTATVTLDGDLLNTGTLTASGITTFTGTRVQTLQLLGALLSTSTGVINFNGTVAPVLSSTAAPQFVTVNINNTAGITPSVGWTVFGGFIVGSGATFNGGNFTHTFYNSFVNSGTVTSSGMLDFTPPTAATVLLRGTAFSSSGTVRFGGSGPITFAGLAPTFGSVIIANTHSNGVLAKTSWPIAGSLEVSSGATFKAGTNLSHTVAGNVINAGVLDGQNSTITLNGASVIDGNGSTVFNHLLVTGSATANTDFSISGNFTNNGSFDATGFIVSFTGASSSILAGSNGPVFDSLEIAKTGSTATLAMALSNLNSVAISSGTFDLGSFALRETTGAGSLSIDSGGTLKIGGTNTLPSFTSYTFDPASTVEYAGSSAQTIAAQNYGSLTGSSSGARTLPSSGTVGIAGTFTPGSNVYTNTGSTINFNGASAQTIPAFSYNHLTSSSSGARTLAPSGNINVAGTFTPGANSYTVTNSTINFSGAAQTIPAFTYYNLTTSGSGAKTLGGNITNNGTLTLSAGSLANGGFNATVNGNLNNSVAHSGSGKIILSGGSAPHAISGVASFNNLELNDSNGATLNATNLTVGGTLTLTAGTILTDTNKVVLSGSGTIARAAGHIAGNLQKPISTGSPSLSFEIGDATNFAPVNLVFTNVTVAGSLLAKTIATDHPDIARSGLLSSKTANRYWSITNSGVVFSNYNATFRFVSSDLDGPANPTNFSAAKLTGTNWAFASVSSRTMTNTTITNVTSFSDFQLGEFSKSDQAITFGSLANKTYGTSFGLAATASSGLPVSFAIVSGPATISGGTNVSLTGTGTVVVRASQAGDDNYNAAPNVDQSFDVTKAVLTVTADGKSKTYGATNPVLTANYSGFVNGENSGVLTGSPSLSTSATTNSTVAGSPYTITVSAGTLTAANYTFSFVNGNLSVNAAGLTITSASTNRIYGTGNPVFTGSVVGLQNNDNITATYSTIATPNSAVGNYSITQTLSDPGSKLGNYTVMTNSGLLSVTSAALTIASDSTNRVYGATNPTFTGSVVGLQNNDNITAAYSTTATTNSAIGNYTISQALNDPDTKLGNYSVTTNNGLLSVTVAALTVSVNSTNRGMGEANPIFTGTISGLQNNDNITANYTSAANAASPAGTYDIYPEFVDPDTKLGNYTVTTNLGTLTVDGPLEIDTQPVSLTIGAGTNAVFTVVASGTSLNYQWRNGTNLVDGGNISGATSASLTLGAVSQADASTNYTVYISNSSSNVTSAAVSLTVIDPPAITVQPLSRTNIAETMSRFSVTASGTELLYYQWQLNGTNLPGEIFTNLNVLSVQVSDAGSYTVVITNEAGSVTSAPAILDVLCTLKAIAGVGGTVAKNPDALSYDAGSSVELTATPQWGFVFTGWSGDASGMDNPLTVVMDGNKNITANFMGPGAEIIVDNDQATFVGNWAYGYGQPGHYGADYWLALPGTTNETARATYRPEIVRSGDYDVYIQYPEKYNRSTNAQWLISYDGGNTLVSVNQKINGSGMWFLIATNKPFVAGTNQFVRVSNDTGPGEGGTNTFIIADAVRFVYSANNGVAPTFITHPQNQTVNQTSNVTFTVSATGTGTVAYQWRFNNEPISGATDSSYTRTNLQASDAGNYAVVVIHDTGSAISSNAVLSVNLSPTIITQPANKTIAAGRDHTFAVVVVGTPPLSYQWRFNSNNIPGATNSSYTLANISAGDAGYYSVVVSNMLAAVTSLNALLTVSADSTNPSVAFIYPSVGAKVSNAAITMTGAAKDNIAVSEVKYVFEGVTNTATGTTSWSAPLTLTPGTNVVVAWSIDPSGNESLRKTNKFYYNSTNFLALNIVGNGQVSGVANGQGLLVGRPYTATAFIGKGTNYVFTNWTGTITSTNSTLPFIMQSNMVLTANFIPNPFTPTAGNYNGLFYETNEVKHESSGFFSLKLSAKAGYTGKLIIDGNSVSVSGKFDLSGRTSKTISRSKLGKAPLALELEMDWSTTNETVHGTLTDGNWTAEMLGDRAIYDAIYNPTTNFLGRYTLVIPPPTNGPVSAPGGYGYATVSNSAAGNIRITKGALGDGTVLSQSVPISKSGQWPLYVPAYKQKAYYTNGPIITTNKTEARGSLLGWVTFTNVPTRTLVGTVNWIKTELPPTNTYYAAGFTNQTKLLASGYAQPAIGMRLLNMNNGSVIHSEGNLILPLTNNIFIKTNNGVTIDSQFVVTGMKLSFDAKTGLLKGSFVHPDNANKVTPFFGAVLQDQNVGAGFFLGANQSGSVTLEEND